MPSFQEHVAFFQLGCSYAFSKIMAVQHIYTYTNMWKNVLGADKLQSIYKKGKVHGKEYWMFKYYQLLCFQMFKC